MAPTFGKRNQEKQQAESPGGAPPPKRKSPLDGMSELSFVEKIFCAWPMALVFVGGAVGGGAWALNIQIMRKTWPAGLRYLLAILVGLGVIAVYLMIALALALMFPELFNRA